MLFKLKAGTLIFLIYFEKFITSSFLTENVYSDFYLGCFNENNGSNLHDLNYYSKSFNQLTSQICIEHCRTYGFMYAGTNNQTMCSCDDSYGKYGNSTDCFCPCTNSTEKCGCSRTNRVYKVLNNTIDYYSTYQLDYVGCFFNPKLIPFRFAGPFGIILKTTIESCYYECRIRNYMYVVLQNSNIFDNYDNSSELKCNFNCYGNSLQMCGGNLGGGYRSIYNITLISKTTLEINCPLKVKKNFKFTCNVTAISDENNLTIDVDFGDESSIETFNLTNNFTFFRHSYSSVKTYNLTVRFENSSLFVNPLITTYDWEFNPQSIVQVKNILADGSADISGCLSNCTYNGKCVSVSNKIQCICFPGFTGKACEIDLRICSPKNSKCLNNGLCNEANNTNGFICNCMQFYTGFYCESKIDLCENVTCYKHGNCVDLGNSTRCDCFNLYFGDLCQTESAELVKIKQAISIASILAFTIIIAFYFCFILMDFTKYCLCKKKKAIGKKNKKIEVIEKIDYVNKR